MATGTDPWGWSVDEVVHFFQNRAADNTADLPHGRLPPLDSFLPTLKENDIDGATLLTQLDTNTLKTDLGVASLGVRNAVLRCIIKLRHESIRYTSDQSSQALQLPTPPAPQPTPVEATPQQAATPIETSAEKTRPGELQVQDAQGRKRRKLNVTQLMPVQEEELRTNKLFTAVKSTDQANPGYLGEAPFPIDDLFFGKTKFGEEIGDLNPDGEILVDKADLQKGLADQNFYFFNQNKPIGEARYVNKHIRRFLAADESRDLQRNGRSALALVPYGERLQSSRSVTVIQYHSHDNEPIAVREHLEHLESGHTPDEYMQQTAGEWDFLVKKHESSEDDLLPVYGESDDDDDGDETIETTEGDLRQDEAEEAIDDHVLDKERVVEIVDGAVNEYVVRWQHSLEKLETRKAWTVWKQRKGNRRIRDALIQGAQDRIDHLTARLNNLKKEIGYSEYRTEKAVEDACVSLQVTVEDREEWKWKIDVWKRKQEPYHAVRHGAKHTQTGLVTPLTTGKADRPMLVPANDRLSVSPGPVDHMNVGIDTEEEIQYEADNETDQHMMDEDDQEFFDTPEHMPEGDGDTLAFLASSDEMDVNQEAISPATNGQPAIDSNTDIETMPLEPQPEEDKDSNFSPKDEESSSDELPSPSTFMNTFISTPAPKAQKQVSSSIIDLTGMSSESSATKREKTKKKASARADPYQGFPGSATAEIADSWEMPQLRKKGDRERILIKILRGIGAANRQRLFDDYNARRPNFTNHLLVASQTLRQNGNAGLDIIKDGIDAITLAASIFIFWLFPHQTSEEIQSMRDVDSNKELGNNQLDLYSRQLYAYLQKRDSSLFQTPQATPTKLKSSQSKSTPSKIKSFETVEVSSDEPSTTHERAPQIKRKRAVKISEDAKTARAKAHLREQKFAESQTANSSQLAALIPSDSSLSAAIEVNPVRDENQDPIYVCDRIARKMKPHQIDGVRFLWREITADDEDDAQGCVLAHTMGLGKTMQTIALLVAVNEAAKSKDASTCKQLPKHLRPKGIRKPMMRILILCPASLIENWNREINEWAPRMLGPVYSLDSPSQAVRIDQLEEWMDKGGVVLVGYERFRGMILQKTRTNQKNVLPNEAKTRLQQMLLEGPEIAVADEAHKLKDRGTSNAKCAAMVETHSRIALTGTPMSNNVEEIYALISWAAPGYLGEPAEFKANYAEPIAAGTDIYSSPYQRRKGLMKLKVLHSEIQPKVNRANIEVLKGSLKPKIEFVITVPLQEVQTQLYKRYVKALLSGGLSEETSQVKLFGWISQLQLLTNHPHCFRWRLLNPPKPQTSNKKANDNPEEGPSRHLTPMTTDSGSVTPISETTANEVTSGDAATEDPDEQSLEDLELNQKMILDILKGFEADSLDHQLSSKMAIFLPLLQYSLECGDKVILFSKSIPTLDYLAELLVQQKLAYGRIDGKQNMKQKMRALEDFHNDDFDVMLVSTKAGGVGLNIQGANRVFIFDWDFNPTWEEQAIGRAYRIGQTKPVFVYRFVAGGTFETNLYNKQLFKTSLSKRVVDKKNPARKATRNTLDYLYEPKPVKQESLDDEIGKDPNVLDRLLSQHGPGDEGKHDTMIRGIQTWETLQVEELDEPLNEEEQREVDMEIKQGLIRTKGKRPIDAPPQALPSTAPNPHAHPGLVRLPMPSQPGFDGRPGPAWPQNQAAISASIMPPPSTFSGPMDRPQGQSHPYGGLPLPRDQQPYQQ